MTTPAAPPVAHGVVLYDGDDALLNELLRYATRALRGRGELRVVCRPERAAALRSGLRTAGVDVPAAEAAGRLVVRDAYETLATLLVDGRLDRSRVEAVLREQLVVPSDRPLSIYGEMVALLWERGDVENALALEDVWVGLQAESSFDLLCSYPRAALRDADLRRANQLCQRHSDATVCGQGPRGLSDVFVASPRSARAARDFVRRALQDCEWPGEEPDVVLVASELVTNAVRHAGSAFRLTLAPDRTRLRLEVEDASTEPPRMRTADSSAVGGRGVTLIERLSASWGHRLAPDGGKVVWAEFVA